MFLCSHPSTDTICDEASVMSGSTQRPDMCQGFFFCFLKDITPRVQLLSTLCQDMDITANQLAGLTVMFGHFL